LKNKIYAEYKLEKPVSSIELIDRYDKLVQDKKIEDNTDFRIILRKR
jgi:hypothetical protein